MAEVAAPKTFLQRLGHLVRGPRLQIVNLATFYLVVLYGHKLGFAQAIGYPNPPDLVLLSVAVATVFELVLARLRWGEWRMPWGTVVATMGIWLLLGANGSLPFVVLPLILVASKHLIRTREGHLFNANNLAAATLILLPAATNLDSGWVRVAVHEWGADLYPFCLMLFFGTVATVRAKRFALAVTYLALAGATYLAITFASGTGDPWGATLVLAYNAASVQLGFFAVTDPATTPGKYPEQLAYAAAIVALGIPGTLAGRPDAVVFAILAAAPQRHIIAAAVARLRRIRQRQPHALAAPPGPPAPPAPPAPPGGAP